jgi:WD40 repeat protein
MLPLLTLAAVLSTAPDADPTRILWTVAVSPDGRILATSGTPAPWLRDPDTLEPTREDGFIPPGQATAVDFHPSGILLGITGPPELTGLADLESSTFTVIPTEEGARGIDFNHDGSLVAISENSGALSVWSVEPLTLRFRDDPPESKSLTGVAWHPTTDVLVTVGEFVTIHDLSNDEPAEPNRIRHRPDAEGHCLLLGVDWHPSGEYFTVSDYGNPDTGDHPTIQFRSPDGELIRSIERPGSEIRNVRWNRAGDRLAATADALAIYDRDLKVLSETAADPNLWGLDWSHDGRSMYTTDGSGEVTRWDADNETRARFIERD